MLSQIVAIGEGEQVRGFALAGVDVVLAADPADARAAWAALPTDVALVILTRAAHAALGADALAQRAQRLWAVLPQ
ncbi:MAG: V-type ATP synthase subunit F [Solirubrobacteraceae bacterium]